MMVTVGNLVLAAKFMLIAVIFDSVDGWIARKTKRENKFEFGKNVDSLSDIVSFGVAPGMLLYSSCISYHIPYLNTLVALLIVICGILRLARFNVLVQGENFVGLPIPSAALILASFYLSGLFRRDVSLVIMTIVSILMISTIQYPKIKGGKTVTIGAMLVVATCLPQSILSPVADIPAKLLFTITLLYLLIVPFRGLCTKLLRSGPDVR